MPASKHKLYNDAYTPFVKQGMTCNAIASQLSISENTLSRWRVKMNWDKLRNEFLPLKKSERS
ncbi:hypothetical protein Barb6XT_02934 [Bacteroidales bacterium Barb6XT]|nr:hypothetical protein Barb6XT_02934 [Bacteroidales bacterium Barb6XT]